MTPAETTKRWRKYQYLGISRSIPSIEIFEHVDGLISYGATYQSVADAADVSRDTVFTAMRGDNQVTYYDAAQKILSVTTTDIYALPNTLVRAVGTRRRIQALLTLGWTHKYMTERVGFDTKKFIRARDWTSTEARAKVVEMYDELCMTPGPSKQTATKAKNNGYRPPLWYVEEHLIDFETKEDRGWMTARDRTERRDRVRRLHG